jgi:hypothetical protein
MSNNFNFIGTLSKILTLFVIKTSNIAKYKYDSKLNPQSFLMQISVLLVL